jgi:hypothetical protein
MANPAPISEQKHVNQPKKGTTVVSSIDFLQVGEVRESIVVLKEGQMRAIIGVSSANFALKSTKEQDIIISTFQGILNSLDTPIQILVQSRKIDLTNYIDKLKKLEDLQRNDLLKIKMQEYIIYIQQMIQQINIMSKQFYVIVGYDPVSLKDDLFGRFFRNMSKSSYVREDAQKFSQHRAYLMQRTESIAQRLSTLDLKTSVLTTDQIIALLYNSYNPDTLESIKIDNFHDLDLEDYEASPVKMEEQN